MEKGKKIDKVGFSSTIVMFVVIIYLFFEIIYKILSTNSLENALWEIVLLFIIIFLFSFLNKEEFSFSTPTTLLGSKLLLSNNKKKERMNTYLLESMMFALFLCLVNTLVYVFISPDKALMLFRMVDNFEIYNLIINLFLFFFVITGVFFGVNSYLGERNVKMYLDYVRSFEKIKENYNSKTIKIMDAKKKQK